MGRWTWRLEDILETAANHTWHYNVLQVNTKAYYCVLFVVVVILSFFLWQFTRCFQMKFGRSSRNFSIYLTKGSHSPRLFLWLHAFQFHSSETLMNVYMFQSKTMVWENDLLDFEGIVSKSWGSLSVICLSSEILTLMLGIDSSAE